MLLMPILVKFSEPLPCFGPCPELPSHSATSGAHAPAQLREPGPSWQHDLAAAKAEPIAVILEAQLNFHFKTSDEVMGSAENCSVFCAIELIAHKKLFTHGNIKPLCFLLGLMWAAADF